MNELKTCPFCGGNDIQIDEMESFWDKNETSWRVLCIDCIAETAGDTKEQAIAAWSRRAGKDTNAATNADRIRSMSDEELVAFLASVFCAGMSSEERGDDFLHSFPWTLDWIRQPSEE